MSAAPLGQLAELAELLAAHFDEGELRGLALELLARTDYSQIPGRTASVSQISQWIAELVSMHRLDPERLFARLIELRPRVPALAQLRDRWESDSETQETENKAADVPQADTGEPTEVSASTETTDAATGSEPTREPPNDATRSEPTREPPNDAPTGSDPTDESSTSPTRGPFTLHKRATIIWASLLLVIFLAVFFIAPDQLPTYKLTMVPIIVALMAGFLAMQMTGTVLLQVKGKVGPWHAVIKASSGLAVVIFLLIWWPRDALFAADEVGEPHLTSTASRGADPPTPQSPRTQSKESTGVTSTGSLEETSSTNYSDSSVDEVLEQKSVDKRPQKKPQKKPTKKPPLPKKSSSSPKNEKAASQEPKPDKDEGKPTPKTPNGRWTVTGVKQLGASTKVSLQGPQLPESGVLKLVTPVEDDREFTRDVMCRIEAGPTKWCMRIKPKTPPRQRGHPQV